MIPQGNKAAAEHTWMISTFSFACLSMDMARASRVIIFGVLSLL
jgi:hypothetical protein